MISPILAVSLGTFFLVTFTKFLSPVKFLPAVTLAVVGAVSLGLSAVWAWVYAGWEAVPLLWLGSSGLALVIHAAHKSLTALGDAQRVALLGRWRR